MNKKTQIPEQRPVTQKLFRMASEATTLSDRPIFLSETHPENALRGRAADVQSMLIRGLMELRLPNDVFLDCELKFRRAYADPKHYGDNTPDLFFSGGKLCFPDATFTYYRFFGFALSGYTSPYKGFSEELELDPRLSYANACALVGLLDVDAAVIALDNRDYLKAGATLPDAWEAQEEMRSGKLLASLSNEAKTLHQRKGGQARHKEVQKLKPIIISEWETGRFLGNKTEAARWAIKEYEIGDQTVKEWLREYERQKAE